MVAFHTSGWFLVYPLWVVQRFYSLNPKLLSFQLRKGGSFSCYGLLRGVGILCFNGKRECL